MKTRTNLRLAVILRCAAIILVAATAPLANAQTKPTTDTPTPGKPTPGPPASSTPTLDTPSLSEAVAKRVQAEIDAQTLVGISVGIIHNNRVAFTQSFGLENREQSIPSSKDTMYRWASISKPLTAIVAIKLAQQGKLDLDEDIRTYVPEFPDKGDIITARQLLAHQGGIVHYTNGPVIPTKRKYNTKNPYKDAILALDTFQESPLVNKPGAAYAYSTRGYMLLGAVLQRAANKPYPQLVQELVLDPAQMNTTQPDYQWIDIPHRAVGYRLVGFGDKERIRRTGNTDVSWKLAGGGYISNIQDLANFAAALLDDTLLDQTQKTQMWTRQRTADGNQTSYGLGFATNGKPDEHRRVSHSGSQQKAKTYLLIAPHQHAAVVLMSNAEHAKLATLARDLLKITIQNDHTTPDHKTDPNQTKDHPAPAQPPPNVR